MGNNHGGTILPQTNFSALLQTTDQEKRKIEFDVMLLMSGVFFLALAYLYSFLLPQEPAHVSEAVKALAAILLGWPVLVSAMHNLRDNSQGSRSDQLVSIAFIAAMAGSQFSTAAFVLILLKVGHFFEERSVIGAQAAISGLQKLHARTACVLTADGEVAVETSALELFSTIVVRPGEAIPADGVVVWGQSVVDQSSVTGENLPHEVDVNTRVFAGSINLTGPLHIRVEAKDDKTVIGRIQSLLNDATQSKSPVVKALEKYASAFIPLVLLIAAFVFLLTGDLSRAITILIVSCPGAFVLAGPSAMVAALAAASRQGILIKNTKFLECMADVDTILFDKTGTLTNGSLSLVAICPTNGNELEMLTVAASCAVGSRHPISRAVVAALESRLIPLPQALPDLKEVFGKGMVGTYNSEKAFFGKEEFLVENGFHLGLEISEPMVSIVWLAVGKRVLGYFVFRDELRIEALEAIKKLRELNIVRMVLLTGDRVESAAPIGRTLNLDEVRAQLLPEQKLAIVSKEKEERLGVMVVGDGVNDALALAAGDVGVAMGVSASDIALGSADVALLVNDLLRLPRAILLARATRRVINQNVLASALCSGIMIILAATGILNPITGAIIHNVGEVFVVLNSARLFKSQC
jgi:Cd2+/Zn2+-exporting ATPase